MVAPPWQVPTRTSRPAIVRASDPAVAARLRAGHLVVGRPEDLAEDRVVDAGAQLDHAGHREIVTVRAAGATTMAIAIASALAARVGSAATVAAVVGVRRQREPVDRGGQVAQQGRVDDDHVAGRRRRSARAGGPPRSVSGRGDAVGVGVGSRRDAVDRHAAGQGHEHERDRDAEEGPCRRTMASHAAQASSRRMTGKRSSAIASAKPAASQNAGVAALVASARAAASG